MFYTGMGVGVIMGNLINELHRAINMLKDFIAGYSSKHANQGYMYINYKGIPYGVKVVKLSDTPVTDDNDHLKWTTRVPFEIQDAIKEEDIYE